MPTHQGFILLHRRLLEWEWYSDLKVCRVFIHLLLKANHKPNKWQGIEVNRGEYITSYSKLATQTSLSVKEIRTVISKLQRTNEVVVKSNTKHTILQLVNYNSYQSGANEGHTKGQTKGEPRANQGQQTTMINNDNNEKEVFGKPTENERPTIEIILPYFKTRTTAKFEAKNFFDYYEAQEWQDQHGKIINWKQKAISWISRIDNKQEQPKAKKYKEL